MHDFDRTVCSRNSKSHFGRNLLAIRKTNSTLIVCLGTKGDLLVEQLLRVSNGR